MLVYIKAILYRSCSLKAYGPSSAFHNCADISPFSAISMISPPPLKYYRGCLLPTIMISRMPSRSLPSRAREIIASLNSVAHESIMPTAFNHLRHHAHGISFSAPDYCEYFSWPSIFDKPRAVPAELLVFDTVGLRLYLLPC